LKAEFDALSMKDEDIVDDFARKLTAMSVRYSNLGGSLEDSVMVKKLFDTVPNRFLNVVAGIEQFYDLKSLAFDEAVGRLKAFEERIRWGAASTRGDGGQLLLTQAEWEVRQKKSGDGESSGRGKAQDGGGCGRGRGRCRGGRARGGRSDASSRGGAGRGKDKSHIKCFKCHTYGHYANRCPSVEQKGEEVHHARADGVDQPQALMLAVTEEVQSGDERGVLNLTEAKVFPELHLTGAASRPTTPGTLIMGQAII
jgi:hypothetical protein